MYTITFTFNLWPPMFISSGGRVEKMPARPPRRTSEEISDLVDDVTSDRHIVTESVTASMTRQKAVRASKPKLCPYCNENPLPDGKWSCSPRCRKRRERVEKKKGAPSRKRPVKSAKRNPTTQPAS